MSFLFSSLNRPFFAAVFIFSILHAPLFAEKKVIAIVRDGDSQFFDATITHFTKELDRLSEGKYTYRLKDEYNARYKDGEALPQLNKALADHEVDLIYTEVSSLPIGQQN